MTDERMIGLRHIVEDGIRILDGYKISSARKQYVLAELRDFLSEANRGSELLHENAWVIPPSERNAFESFSLIDAFFNSDETSDINRQLSVAKETVQLLAKKNAASPSSVATTKEFLQSLLECIKEHNQTGIMPEFSETYIAVSD